MLSHNYPILQGMLKRKVSTQLLRDQDVDFSTSFTNIEEQNKFNKLHDNVNGITRIPVAPANL